MRRRWLSRALAACIGVSAGVAAGFLITDGDFLALVAAAACIGAMIGVSYVLLPEEARASVLPVVALATVARIAVAVVLYDGLIAAGRGGFVTGDDAFYAAVSTRLAEILHGTAASFDGTREFNVLGTFVFLETAVFYVFGPDVRVMEVLNAAMGGLLVTFAVDIGRRIFGNLKAGLAAGIVVAVYPSLVLWSALNLKDALTLLLIAIVLWLIAIFHGTRKWWLVPVAFAPLILLESLRGYIFVGLALVIPAAAIFGPTVSARERVRNGAVAIVLAAVFLGYHFTVSRAGIPSLAELEAQRIAMTVGADTSFAEAFGPESGGDPVTRTLRYLPRGMAYAGFAPFPWSARRTLDLAPIAEMFIFYVSLAAASVTLIRLWPSWGRVLPLVLFVVGMLFVFVLAEGNVGTLYRHRAMVIPFVLILAGPAFARMTRRDSVAAARADRMPEGRLV